MIFFKNCGFKIPEETQQAIATSTRKKRRTSSIHKIASHATFDKMQDAHFCIILNVYNILYLNNL